MGKKIDNRTVGHIDYMNSQYEAAPVTGHLERVNAADLKHLRKMEWRDEGTGERHSLYDLCVYSGMLEAAGDKEGAAYFKEIAMKDAKEKHGVGALGRTAHAGTGFFKGKLLAGVLGMFGADTAAAGLGVGNPLGFLPLIFAGKNALKNDYGQDAINSVISITKKNTEQMMEEKGYVIPPIEVAGVTYLSEEKSKAATARVLGKPVEAGETTAENKAAAPAGTSEKSGPQDKELAEIIAAGRALGLQGNTTWDDVVVTGDREKISQMVQDKLQERIQASQSAPANGNGAIAPLPTPTTAASQGQGAYAGVGGK
ncbi:MAG TPA: hypothetical protein VFT64_00330 [Rickettsiales bacterium]|nr:hypothetical protein [Rickettsiales bacterium]